jgi:hypothetical protein
LFTQDAVAVSLMNTPSQRDRVCEPFSQHQRADEHNEQLQHAVIVAGV